MTSIIKFTPMSGCPPDHKSRSFDPSSTPHCYLLEVDGFTFLLDCGWDNKFSSSLMEDLRPHVPKIDAVLLTFPDVTHLGGLPYLVGKLGLSCPIYATVPVYKMGQMFLYDAFQARHNVEDFDVFTLDEVDKAFEMITQLKYNQSVALKGKGEGIVLTPLPAGHMIGGALWKIVKDGEEDIVYAVDYNNKKEQHLNGCDIEKIQRPSLLITDAYNAKHKMHRRRLRDEQLMTNILQTLRNSGNVLLCVDTAGRVLELAHMVDHLWQIPDSGLVAYSLALLNNVGYNVIEFAKSQIEWMSEKLMRNFEGKRNNPFQFRHLKLCHNMSEVAKVPSPKVVLASMADLESGFSRELFANWCTSPKNSVVVCSRTGEGTLAHDLVVNGTDRDIELEVKRRVKLTGAELEEHRRREREEELARSRAAAADSSMMLDDESSDEEMDTSAAAAGSKGTGWSSSGGAGSSTKMVRHDIIVRPPGAGGVQGSGSQGSQQTGFFKSIKTKHPMFPFYEERIRWDDYGELIKPEEWMDLTTDHDDKKKASAGQHEEDEADLTEVPTKCVSTKQKFHVRCKVHFIDFEGRSDGDSIARAINTMKPRRAIIVRGKDDACKTLAELCKQVAAKQGDSSSKHQTVFIPRLGETVDATTESFIYQVRLPESHFAKLEFSQARDGLLAWVDGRISLVQEDAQDVQQEGDREAEDGSDGSDGGVAVAKKSRKRAAVPALLAQPDEERRGHKALFVNELKLSDFKMVLSKAGIPSEFNGGVLFCGQRSKVALRRHDSGRVTIEGAACADYYTVRELLYQQYAIV